MDPLCCHFALAKDLAEKKMPCGVGARDKLLMDAIEAKQEEIFQKKDGRLAETDKEKKALKSVLKLVRTEVENLTDLHGFWRLEIIKKSSGIIGGVFRLEDTTFTFLVDKKKKKAISVEKLERGGSNEGNIKEQYPIFCPGAEWQELLLHFPTALRCLPRWRQRGQVRTLKINNW